MIEEEALVVAVEGDVAWVETQRKSTCGGCSANKGCGTATLSKVLGQRQNLVRVLNPCEAEVGERVILGLAEEAMLKGAAVLYLTPLILLFTFAAVTQWLFAPSSELTIIAAGSAGLLGGLLLVKEFSRRIANDERYQAVILRRISSSQSLIHGVFTP